MYVWWLLLGSLTMIPGMFTMATDLNLIPYISCYLGHYLLSTWPYSDVGIKWKRKKNLSFPKMYTCIGLLTEIRGTELKNASWYKTPRQSPTNMTVKQILYWSDVSRICFLFLYTNWLIFLLFLCRIGETGNNFPEIFTKMFISQAMEIARQCITPPLKKSPK